MVGPRRTCVRGAARLVRHVGGHVDGRLEDELGGLGVPLREKLLQESRCAVGLSAWSIGNRGGRARGGAPGPHLGSAQPLAAPGAALELRPGLGCRRRESRQRRVSPVTEEKTQVQNGTTGWAWAHLEACRRQTRELDPRRANASCASAARSGGWGKFSNEPAKSQKVRSSTPTGEESRNERLNAPC